VVAFVILSINSNFSVINGNFNTYEYMVFLVASSILLSVTNASTIVVYKYFWCSTSLDLITIFHAIENLLLLLPLSVSYICFPNCSYGISFLGVPGVCEYLLSLLDKSIFNA